MRKLSLLNKKGFTLIELLVVIAIIGILASIVLVSVNSIRNKTKIARANVDAKNIEEALFLFYAEYGDYPYSQKGNCPSLGCSSEFYSTSEGGPGEPYLMVNGTPHYLSEFYKSDWDHYNTTYFAKNGFWRVTLTDNDHDGKIGCGFLNLTDRNYTNYGYKRLLCEDCPCGTTGFTNMPFHF